MNTAPRFLGSRTHRIHRLDVTEHLVRIGSVRGLAKACARLEHQARRAAA
jgi:hypothetical protein